MKLFKTALGFVLENIINTAIQTDLDHPRLLKIIDSKRLAVSITDFNCRLVFIGRPEKTDRNKLEVILNQDSPADAEISGTLINLLKLAFSKNPQALLASQIILLKGEVSILQDYQKFMTCLDLDWEGRLSDLIGPTAAAEMGQLARKAKEFQQRSWESSLLDLSEYLTEESGFLPSKKEIESFYQDLRKLRLDIDRFEAQLTRKTNNTY